MRKNIKPSFIIWMQLYLLVIALIQHRQHFSVYGLQKDLKNISSKDLPWMMNGLKIPTVFSEKIILKSSLLEYEIYDQVKDACIRRLLIYTHNVVQVILQTAT